MPHKSSGYVGGMGGQLNKHDYITVITERGTNKVVTAFSSGATHKIPNNYDFILGAQNELIKPKF